MRLCTIRSRRRSDPPGLADLQGLGADLGQGFLFARPLMAADVSALLRGPRAAGSIAGSLDRGVA